jgi:hypothetical protein
MNNNTTGNNNLKNNNTISAKGQPLSDGKQFFRETVTAAIEVLDLPFVTVRKIIDRNSVTKLSRVIFLADTIGPEMAQVIVRSKRSIDHVRHLFNPKQIDNLHGPRAIVDAANLYLQILEDKAKAKAEAEAAKKSRLSSAPEKTVENIAA